ncbi:DUF317 domain-containing protein [Kitasatospora indigofera]|uniref:DUF317 domain-containing protein n=1 Tax=Kitasatospora indigofera TaxID=67307 RepID=UPI003634CFF2
MSPAFLAGPGDARLVTAPLLQLGWTSPASACGVQLESPCRAAFLARSCGGGWELSVRAKTTARSSWSATFGARAPAEIIAAATTPAAAALAGHSALHSCGSGAPRRILDLADIATASGHGWRSPSGHAVLEIDNDPASAARWVVTVKSAAPERGGWRAVFSHGSPFYVLDAVTEAITSHTPVARNVRELPGKHLTDLSTPTAGGGPLPRCRAPHPRPARPTVRKR